MPTTPHPDQETTSPSHTSNWQGTHSTPAETMRPQDERTFTWLVLCLLIALCLGSLASFSLVSPLLTSTSLITTATEQDNITGCTTTPTAIPYLQATSTNKNTTAPPSPWAHAGKNAQQFALAQACAAAFTITYESIDIDDPTTLTAATSMLSTTGRASFFQNTGAQPKDERLTSIWQLHAQKVHLRQNAQVVSEAQLQTIHSKIPTFSASFIVRYKLTTNSTSIHIIQYKQLVVLLQQAPITPSDPSNGWQVADWYNGT